MKKGKGLIITIIILIILLLSSLGYILYDKVIENTKEQKEITNKETTQKEEITTISENKLSYIVNTVPFNTSGYNNDLKTAYAKTKVTINDIKKDLLIQYAFYSQEPEEYKEGMPKFEFDEKENKYKVSTSKDTFPSSGYISFDNINAFIKENYNIELNKEEIEEGMSITAPSCGSIVYVNGYFGWECHKGGSSVTKFNNIENYKIENGKLTINEKVGFLYSGDGGAVLYKDNQETEKIKYISTTGEGYYSIDIWKQEYFDDNQDKFYTYKHTFKIENNNYYWESTELINE